MKYSDLNSMEKKIIDEALIKDDIDPEYVMDINDDYRCWKCISVNFKCICNEEYR